MKPTERPAPWVLELGMRTHIGIRPWVKLLVVAALATPALWVFGTYETEGTSALVPAWVADLVTKLVFVPFGLMVLIGIGYWVVASYAHRCWHRDLTDEERQEMLEEYSSWIHKAMEKLDPRTTTPPLTASDLEDLSAAHRQELQAITTAATDVGEDGFCMTVADEARRLAGAARLHRQLSVEAIGRSGSTELAFFATLVELDEEVTTTAKHLVSLLKAGGCACGDPDVASRIEVLSRRAVDQAAAQGRN